MKVVEVEREVLLTPLQAVGGVVERRHTIAILSNVLINFSEQALSVTATDLELQVVTRRALGTPVEERAITVSARKFLDILRALPEGSRLSLELQERRLVVRCGKARFALQTMPAEDFPKLDAGAAVQGTISVEAQKLRNLISQVQYAMALEDIRFYLNGLMLGVGPDGITAAATDGHRLALAQLQEPLDAQPAEVILPRKAVQELLKLLADVEGQVLVDIAANQISFSFGATVFVSKLVDGKFPDYRKVVPVGQTLHVRLDRAQLLATVQRTGILSNEKFRGVRWVLTEGSLRLVCTNTDQEEAEEELPVDYTGKALDIGFNVTYLVDVLSNLQVPEVECWFSDGEGSMLMTLPSDQGFKYVLMPLRI